jgi:nitrogen regulatory protein PII 1
MKMIRAIIRPEKEDDVVKALEAAGFPSLTKIDVFGRGKQKGIQVGTAIYDELAKTMIMMVVEEPMTQKAVETISQAARTGNFGDGKIFITPVEATTTIRTGKTTL